MLRRAWNFAVSVTQGSCHPLLMSPAHARYFTWSYKCYTRKGLATSASGNGSKGSKTKSTTRKGHGSSNARRSHPPRSTPSSSCNSVTVDNTDITAAGSRADSSRGSATTPEIQVSEAQIAEEERRLAEGDTRLAMRMLMQHYFLYQSNSRRPEDEQLEEERERLREKHRARMERIEEKTRNSLELGASVAVDGILPLYSRPKASGGTSTLSGWRRPNPVEAETATASEAEREAQTVNEEGDDYEDISRLSNNLPRGGHLGVFLAKPDIAVYDAEHDHRIRSAEVLEVEEQRRREELQAGPAATRVLSKEELELTGGLTPLRVVQSQMLDDEDEDFAVVMYENEADE
uniref:Uncharacterized protein n=1 Tax=Trypanosoma congolense (strain IL3000) TaxID=1068625 RepID=G0UN36_TRYCI|nr:conserved hypothetical protein [Trypanosoma congolense IL3000]